MPLLIILGIIVLVCSFLGFYNFFTLPYLKNAKPPQTPFVSIIIPARNEEKNVGRCLEAVLQQDYPSYEIIVCDDQSQDRTAEISSSYGKKVKLIRGKPLPEGWIGKSWACHQAVQIAKGDLLLFLDADVLLQPKALPSAVSLLLKQKAGLVTCFPYQITKTVGEKLLVPVMDWLVLTSVPFRLVNTTTGTTFSIGVGQFMLFTKEAYLHVGGHPAVKTAITEDTELARRMKFLGEKIIVVKSKNLVQCRMYRSFKEAFHGLSRSFYQGARMKPLPYIAAIAFFILIIMSPFVLTFFDRSFAIVFFALISQRIVTAWSSGFPIFTALLLFPIHIVMVIVLTSNSIHISLANKITWKGRKIITKDINKTLTIRQYTKKRTG